MATLPVQYVHTALVGEFTVRITTSLLACSGCGAPHCDRPRLGLHGQKPHPHQFALRIDEAQLESFDRRAARTVLARAAKVPGTALRCARKALGCNQENLAKVLGSNRFQLSRWERSPESEMWLRLAMIALIDRAERGEMSELGTSTELVFEFSM